MIVSRKEYKTMEIIAAIVIALVLFALICLPILTMALFPFLFIASFDEMADTKPKEHHDRN